MAELLHFYKPISTLLLTVLTVRGIVIMLIEQIV